IILIAAISGDGFIARDIGFQNTAGPQAKQAVALYVASDRSVLYRCSISGYQDTLYALAFRQFYRQCDILGTIDFIFGNAAAVFQSCNLVLRQPHSGGFNVILANGRSDSGQNTGFSVQSSRIVRSADFSGGHKAYLGRPWKQYSRSVVMQSSIDGAIDARGWVEWSGGFALKTLYFAEYQNSGPGASTSQRVQWTGFHLISAPDALQFTVAKFIGGNSWLPSTGVTYVSSL
ncbi:probable pectinesterase/pectinesterase inhibitor 35, partial [Macadamia integrifolia]|uniref:probable pectinesterase/pectinesterase inhibitor 35 n=1 Tax=Macadamia integrifolia TaxID=60698 RepID=UPI001C4E5536